MSTNRLIHTGLNIQFGGEKKGFFNVSYQVGMAGMVKREPKKPADWQEDNAYDQFNNISKFHFIHPFFPSEGIRKGVLFLYSRYSEPIVPPIPFSSTT